MAERPRGSQVATIIWSILISIGVIALGASILLPSTKRARFDFRHQQEMRAQQEQAALPATEPASTQP